MWRNFKLNFVIVLRIISASKINYRSLYDLYDFLTLGSCITYQFDTEAWSGWLLQAGGQLALTTWAITQYFCVVDFLRGLPVILYIRILYFHNPDSCGTRVNIGQSIDGLANQAFILMTNLPLPAFRTFIINCVSLGLSVLWIITSVVIIMGGASNKQSKSMRWPWIIITVAICGLDLVATVTYANDSFHTRTLNDITDFIGAVASGVGNVQLDTSWASWIMVLIYSRFVIFFIINVFLLILVIVSLNLKPEDKIDLTQVENPALEQSEPQLSVPIQVSTGVQSSPIPTPPPVSITQDRGEDADSSPSQTQPSTRIPRAGLSKSFRRMKTFLFRKSSSPEIHRRRSDPESVEVSPDVSPRAQHEDLIKKRTVNFPQSLLSLPQRLENIIAEQQKRLDRAVIDTSGRNSPPRVSQSMPQLATTSTQLEGRGRRGTTAELQGQLPWAYIPASAHRMRDQLPPDEDLPPVPLPDYTAFQSVRKASVHRAASNLSSLIHKKDQAASQSVRTPLHQSDVLY